MSVATTSGVPPSIISELEALFAKNSLDRTHREDARIEEIYRTYPQLNPSEAGGQSADPAADGNGGMGNFVSLAPSPGGLSFAESLPVSFSQLTPKRLKRVQEAWVGDLGRHFERLNGPSGGVAHPQHPAAALGSQVGDGDASHAYRDGHAEDGNLDILGAGQLWDVIIDEERREAKAWLEYTDSARAMLRAEVVARRHGARRQHALARLEERRAIADGKQASTGHNAGGGSTRRRGRGGRGFGHDDDDNDDDDDDRATTILSPQSPRAW